MRDTWEQAAQEARALLTKEVASRFAPGVLTSARDIVEATVVPVAALIHERDEKIRALEAVVAKVRHRHRPYHRDLSGKQYCGACEYPSPCQTLRDLDPSS